jgi:hypothetical protein
MKNISSLIGAFALVCALNSCGGSTDTTTSPPPPPPCPAGTFCMGSAIFYTVAANFTNATLNVARNAAVTWTNDSGTPHDVIFDTPGALAVGNGSAGNIPIHSSGSNQRQFAAAGTYAFHCGLHGTPGAGMHGTVVVQ